MPHFDILILLMAAAILVVGLAQKLNIPYPLVLILGGATISFIPHTQVIAFDPQLLQTIVLPPILYYGAFWMSFNEVKRYLRDILSLSLGLVCVTTLLIGLLFHWLFPEFPWALAFAFGALVSPPDATAATAILKRFSISPRLMTILEGESLVNDAFALVLYKLAVVSLLSGIFSWSDASFEFVKTVTGGITFGLIFGSALLWFSAFFFTPVIGVMFSFVIPYITYISADALGVSGVLAVVVNGLLLSRIYVKHLSSARRILAVTPWDMLITLMNCFVFILIGLQLRKIAEEIRIEHLAIFTAYGLLITAAMIGIRLLWVYFDYGFAYLRAKLNPKRSFLCPQIVQEGMIISWTGMRGIITLTAALALPIFDSQGTPLSGRNVVIFITFVVMFLSLLIPTLSLPSLLRLLKIHHKPDTWSIKHHRRRLLETAEKEISDLSELSETERSFLLNYFRTRQHILEISGSDGKHLQRIENARKKVLESMRKILLESGEKREIDDKLLKILELELDLEESVSIRVEIK